MKCLGNHFFAKHVPSLFFFRNANATRTMICTKMTKEMEIETIPPTPILTAVSSSSPSEINVYQDIITSTYWLLCSNFLYIISQLFLFQHYFDCVCLVFLLQQHYRCLDINQMDFGSRSNRLHVAVWLAMECAIYFYCGPVCLLHSRSLYAQKMNCL